MRAAGVDYGAQRIGLAISDASGVLARPVAAVRAGNSPRASARAVATELKRLAGELGDITVVVIGLPRHLDGTPNQQTPAVEAFASALTPLVPSRILLQDERLTSHEADRLLAEREPDWRARKQKLDAAAAAVILQEYLDRPRPADAIPTGDDTAGPRGVA